MQPLEHTPGPWTARRLGVGWEIDNKSGAMIVTDAYCFVSEREANAKLIAAAPELLEALRRIRSMVSTVDGYSRAPSKIDAEQLCVDVLHQATMALARARGCESADAAGATGDGSTPQTLSPAPRGEEGWKETVRKIYDELHFGQDSVFEGDGRELARRVVRFIEKQHADYFCEGLAAAPKAPDAALNALPPPPTADWRDIESAPRDGTRVLLFLPKSRGDAVWTGLWAEGSWVLSYGRVEQGPTHWQPLPPPPKGSGT